MSDRTIRRPAIRAAVDPGRMNRYRLEAWALASAWAVFRALGVDRGSALGGWLGRMIGPRTGRDRTARRNLRLAFPGMAEAEIDAVVREMWDNVGRTLAECIHMEAFDALPPGGRFEMFGDENIEIARASGRPVVFFSGHFGNWELLPRVPRQYGFDVGVIYRAPNNPFVHERLLRMRRRDISPRQFPKGQVGTREVVAHFSSGGHLAMLVDQKLNDGVLLPFVGRPAMTGTAAAQLALKYDGLIVPVSMERLGGARFRVGIHPPIELVRTDDRAADIEAATLKINDLLSDWIRARPSQWLWIHNRWPR